MDEQPEDKLLASLTRQHGAVVAPVILAQMVGAAKGPFGPGRKRYAEHVAFAERVGVTPFVGKEKPPTTGPGASIFDETLRRRR